MKLAEIEALPVAKIMAKDSVLALWVYDPLLPGCIDAMASWGFNYKTVAFTWVKCKPSGAEHMTGGYYTRGNPETCLLGTRGRGLRRADAGVRQLVEAPVGRHSAKPDEVYRRIERLFGDVRRVELFARQVRVGWTIWGDEVPAARGSLQQATPD